MKKVVRVRPFSSVAKIAQIGQIQTQRSRLYDCLLKSQFKAFKAGLNEPFLKNRYNSHFKGMAFKELKFDLKRDIYRFKWGLNETVVFVRKGQKSEIGKIGSHIIHGKHKRKKRR